MQDAIFVSKMATIQLPWKLSLIFFFDCPFVKKVIDRFIEKFFKVSVNKKQFFTSEFTESEQENAGANLVLDALRYSIWQIRLSKNNISFYTVEYETINLIEHIVGSSNKIKQALLMNSLLFIDGRDDGGADRQQFPGSP